MNFSSRSMLLLVIAILIAAFTAMSVRNRLSQTPVETAQPAPVSNRVIVARRDIAAGSFVQGSQDLEWMTMSESDIRDNYLREGTAHITDFSGAIARRSLKTGEVLTQSAVMKSGDGGFLSAVLEHGMRAVSIAVNATSGNAGFISPGDKVDLIVTHRVKIMQTSNGAGDESIVGETFVRDVRVVAVDQMLENPDNKAILAKTVTVEVSPRQAEQIAVAEEMGKISVVLRSIAVASKESKEKDEATYKKPRTGTDATPAIGQNPMTDLYGGSYTRDSDISELLDHKGVVAPRVRVVRGDQSENLEFYQDTTQ